MHILSIKILILARKFFLSLLLFKYSTNLNIEGFFTDNYSSSWILLQVKQETPWSGAAPHQKFLQELSNAVRVLDRAFGHNNINIV